MPTTRLFPIGPSPATTATASTRPVAPFFLDPIEALDHSDQSIFQDQPRGRQWRATVVGQRAAHSGAGATDHRRLRVVTALDLPLDGSDPTDPLLQLLLGVAIRLQDRLGRLAQVVELAELMRNTG